MTATSKQENDEHAEQMARHPSASVIALWALVAIYVSTRFLQIFPGRVPMLVIVALHVVAPALFALLHGAMFYRLRGILVFFAICLVVGNIVENVGVRTGLPFGRYYFSDVMGPKLSAVPILLGLAYVGMGYLSWTVARIILGDTKTPLARQHVVTLPLVASFIMVAWDLSQEPVWATVERIWIWVHGGPYFGVPVSNFLGWYLTVYVIYQFFALYLRRSEAVPTPFPAGYWALPILLYAVSAAGNTLLVIPRAGLTVVADSTGARWQVNDITGTCALISIFTMGAFALLAAVRLGDKTEGASG